MQNKQTKQTSQNLIIAAIFLILLAGYCANFFFSNQNSPLPPSSPTSSSPSPSVAPKPVTKPTPLTIPAPAIPTVKIAGKTLFVDIAKTSAEQTRGLSGRQSIANGRPGEYGMLFVFEKPAAYGFWMPDMLFSIDIIWIGADQKIVDIARNVSPESYPKIFKPTAPALYALEVPAGFTEKNGLKVWDGVTFSLLY